MLHDVFSKPSILEVTQEELKDIQAIEASWQNIVKRQAQKLGPLSDDLEVVNKKISELHPAQIVKFCDYSSEIKNCFSHSLFANEWAHKRDQFTPCPDDDSKFHYMSQTGVDAFDQIQSAGWLTFWVKEAISDDDLVPKVLDLKSFFAMRVLHRYFCNNIKDFAADPGLPSTLELANQLAACHGSLGYILLSNAYYFLATEYDNNKQKEAADQYYLLFEKSLRQAKKMFDDPLSRVAFKNAMFTNVEFPFAELNKRITSFFPASILGQNSVTAAEVFDAALLAHEYNVISPEIIQQAKDSIEVDKSVPQSGSKI
jgi:hypothetical protein